MIFSNTSNYMLKYQKAKAKLVEYDIPQKDYPKFPLNSNELSYPVVYILSRYAESVIENNIADMEEFSPHLVAASQYFDAAVGANDRAEYDVDFLLSGAASYFLSDDFGSAKVLCSEYFARINPETNVPQKIMGNLLGYLLLNRDFHISEDTPYGEKVCRSLLAYYNTGKGAEEIQNLLSEYRKVIYENDAPMEIYYVDILCAIVTVALSKSSWSLLPRYSELDQSLWSDYLKSPKAPRMLWPAQQLIGEKGVLRGQSAIVQLPTGVGKTKSIELIIRSSFASDRATTAIIVAPLRALCNEIANDMISAFGDEVLVNQFSDVLEEDFSLDLFLSLKSKILICTPEKLSYIIHHQADFLDEIGLYIFDEGHMFDDGSRGAIYELLISEIRGHISWGEQIILLSAVLSNAEQIQKWLLGEAGVLASDPKIKATPKMIGFASQTKDIHYYSNDSAQEDFYVPRSIEVIALQKRPREKKQRYFPELTDAKDIAIYYANKLCKNGGAAIFANRTSTVLTVINRIIELRDRGHDLAEIKGNSDGEEMNRLAQLMSDYYGEQHPYTIACYLGVVPHYQEQYDADTRWTDRIISSSGDWSGNVYDFYFRVYNKLIQDIKVPFKMEGGTRVDDTNVHKALREALANCLVHADYYGRQGLVIIKKRDSITMANPGGFRIEIDAAKSGGVSDPRNGTMLKLFNLIDIGERSGRGIPLVFSAWREQGWAMPAVTEQLEPERTILTLTFEKIGDKKSAIKIGDKKSAINAKMKETIIAYLTDNPEAKASSIAEYIGLKPSRTRD